jgi:hypothetical protein
VRVILLFTIALLSAPGASAQGTSLRFHGAGAGDLDRVKIRVDDPADPLDEPGPPVDVGAQDFTAEFWIKGELAGNSAPAIAGGFGENWIYGNVVFDRDRREPGGCDWGISLGEGRLAFGVTNASLVSVTLCGSTDVLDGAWHHVAVARRRADGFLWLWVDGSLDASGDGPDGDVSYPGADVPGGANCGGAPCVNSDPFLVLGAEKHDAGPQFPSFDGWLDEIRFSNVLRYETPFASPTVPFGPDSATVALYHLDEGTGDDVLDASGAPGGPSHGERRFGGTPVPGPQWSAETPFTTASTALVDVRGLPDGAVFEAHPNPSLGQTILFARFPDGRTVPAAVTIHDVGGGTRASVAGEVDGGSAMLIWDGRADDGSALPAGIYFAKLVAGETALSAKFVLR